MPASSLVRLPNGQVKVEISGVFFNPHWVANLFYGLSESRVSVLSGAAVQDAKRAWNATFTLDFHASKLTPESIDYLALAQQSTIPKEMSVPALSTFQVARRPDQQLEVRLEGPDQVGFLSRVLLKLSVLGLFPSELDIKTIGGRIKDRLVLRALADKPISSEKVESLEGLLKQFVAASQAAEGLKRPAFQ